MSQGPVIRRQYLKGKAWDILFWGNVLSTSGSSVSISNH